MLLLCEVERVDQLPHPREVEKALNQAVDVARGALIFQPDVGLLADRRRETRDGGGILALLACPAVGAG